MQERLPTQANEIAGEYIRMENAVPAERWNQVKDHRRIIFYDHWETVLQKLKEIYGDRFNRELFDDAQRYVNEHLPERKQADKSQIYTKQVASRSPTRDEKTKVTRRDENIL